MYFPIMNWPISSCILHWCRWQICPRGNITVFRIYVQVTEKMLMSKTVLYNPQCISFVHNCTIWFSFLNFHIIRTKCSDIWFHDKIWLDSLAFITFMFYSSSIFFYKTYITYIREKIVSDHVCFFYIGIPTFDCMSKTW